MTWDAWVVIGLSLAVAALIGYYLGRKQEPKITAVVPPSTKPYDDSQLRKELATVAETVNKLSVAVAAQGGAGKSSPSKSMLAEEQTGAPVRSLSSASARDGNSEVLADYLSSRSSRSSWKEFEARYSCERFNCTNVREHAQRPTDPLRFETSAGGAYLAARFGSSNFLVFPSFAADPWQLRLDGAMQEVFDFPDSSDSRMLQVVEPAVFTRQGQQWFLQSKGKLEE